jgi:hypothetical protein
LNEESVQLKCVFLVSSNLFRFENVTFYSNAMILLVLDWPITNRDDHDPSGCRLETAGLLNLRTEIDVSEQLYMSCGDLHPKSQDGTQIVRIEMEASRAIV